MSYLTVHQVDTLVQEFSKLGYTNNLIHWFMTAAQKDEDVADIMLEWLVEPESEKDQTIIDLYVITSNWYTLHTCETKDWKINTELRKSLSKTWKYLVSTGQLNPDEVDVPAPVMNAVLDKTLWEERAVDTMVIAILKAIC